MIRRGLGTLLATAGTTAGLVVWLAIDATGAFARSSAAPGAPMEPRALEGIVPEGSSVAVGPVHPVRLAAAEQEPAAEAPAAETQTAARTPAARPGILQVDTDQPLSIRADELEAIEEPDGRRRLIFNRQVKVEQGGLHVQSDRLEAHYAANASQPEKLVANGKVRVQQEKRELSCARATYYPAREQLECTGNALLRDGANRVSGETIEILFEEDRIRVKGGAVVNVTPDEKKPAARAAAPSAPEPAP